MKELRIEELDSLLDEYKNNKIYKVSRAVLSKNKISDLVKVFDNSESVGDSFSIDIKTMEATNQMKSGRCWIFAGLNILREETARKYNLDNFQLSQNYINFYDKLEKCNYFLNSIIELASLDKDDRVLSFILRRGIEDGGQWDMFVNIVKKYGVVPRQVYPETYQSENTNEVLNVLNRYLRKCAFKIRTMYRDGKESEIESFRRDSISKIYKLLCSCFGVPPKKFSFEYVDKDKKYNIVKDITPLDFYNNYTSCDLDQYISIINSPTDDKDFNKIYTIKYLGNVVGGSKIIHLNLPLDRFKELVVRQLSNNELVWFGSDCSKYGDRKSGIWDDNSYDEESLLQIDLSMSKEQMLDMYESSMNHAMVFTGVNLDSSIPTKWKIENSWGSDIAYKGYFIATTSWFDNYVYQAVINKKYLNSCELSSLELEPIELEPWDPMGTLA